jgi:hypothetical protein
MCVYLNVKIYGLFQCLYSPTSVPFLLPLELTSSLRLFSLDLERFLEFVVLDDLSFDLLRRDFFALSLLRLR